MRSGCYFLFLVLLLDCVFAQWELYWSDEFDLGYLDPEKWSHECTAAGGGNEEFQVYTNTPENSWVGDGKLHIRPTLLRNNINPQTGEPFGEDFIRNGLLDLNEIYGYCTASWNNGCSRQGNGDGEWTDIPPTGSARIWSNEKFPFRYGRVEFRAKMPVGDWMWPALWMMPENSCYGEWPVSGEMDIVESIGNEDLRFGDGSAVGMQRMSSAMHWGVSREENRFYLTEEKRINESIDYGRNFHDYTLEWTPNGMRFSVDGELHMHVPDPPVDQNPDWVGFFDFGQPWNDPNQNPWGNNNDPLLAPFDCQFHLIMNVAVGGTSGMISDDAINRGGEFPKPWQNGVTQFEGMNRFYDAEGQWMWTWDKEDEGGVINSAMQVEYVRVYKRSDLPEEDPNDCPARKLIEKRRNY